MEAHPNSVPTIREGFDGLAGDYGSVDAAWSAFYTKFVALSKATGTGAIFSGKGDGHGDVTAADGRATASILLSLKGGALEEAIAVGPQATTRQILRALENRYAPKDKARAMALTNAITSRAWKHDDTPIKVLVDLRVAVAHLNKFPDEDRLSTTAIRAHVLKTLPMPEYEAIVIKHLTSTAPWTDILEEAQRLLDARGALGVGAAAIQGAQAATKGSSAADTAFYGRHQPSNPGRQAAGGQPRRDKSHIKCFNCHKMGHFQSECKSRTNPQPKGDVAFKATNAQGLTERNLWILDSGATTHVTGNKEIITNYEATKQSLVLLGNDEKGQPLRAQSTGKGDVRVTTVDQDGHMISLTLLDVAYVPGAPNLVSEGRILATGATITATRDERRIHLTNGIVLVALADGFLHYMRLNPQGDQAVNTVTIGKSGEAIKDITTLHRRLGHPSAEITRTEAVRLNIPTTGWELLRDCDACRRGKARHQSVGEGPRDRAEVPGQRIFVDMWGPSPSPSLGGMSRATLFLDDASDFATVTYSQGKDSVSALDKFVATNTGNNPKLNLEGATIHTDSESIFVGEPFRQALATHQLKLEASPPHAHELNGRVERKWGTLLLTTRTLLADANLPPEYWVLAMTHAVAIANDTPENGSPTSRRVAAGGSDTRPGDVRTFGCRAYVVNEDAHANKLSDRGRVGIYVGIDQTTRAHRVYMLDTKTVLNTVHVTFVERLRGIDGQTFVDGLGEGEKLATTSNTPTPTATTIEDEPQGEPPTLPNNPAYVPGQVIDGGDTIVVSHVVGEDIKPGQHLSVKQAMARDDADVWRAGMNKEVEVHRKMETMTPVLRSSLPPGTNLLTTKMDLVAKGDGKGNVDRVKARLVVRGFQQIPGVEFSETFAAAASRDTVRTLIASAAAHRWQLQHIDFEAAYLNAPLAEDVYVLPPDGWPEYDDKGRELVYKLDKAVYGLRQAAREWRNMLIGALTTDHGLKASQTDDSLLALLGAEGQLRLLIAVYVDDLLATGPGITDGTFDEFVRNLRIKFNIKVFDATTFLGVNIRFMDTGIKIDQTQFVEAILEAANMATSRPVATPMDTGFADGTSDALLVTAEAATTRARLGELMWLATGTRPDIAFAVMRLARGMSAPTQAHLQGVKRVLRYLNGTKDRGLHYSFGCTELVAYADASFATPPDARSVTGGVVIFAGAAVAWLSKKQTVTALSAAEAEYVALGDVAKRTVIVASLVGVLPGPSPLPVCIFEDNSAAVAMVEADSPTVGNRHLATRAHYARDMQRQQMIKVVKVDGRNNTADILTKALPREQFVILRESMLG